MAKTDTTTDDTGAIAATDEAEIITLTRDELDELIRQDRAGNPAPAIEEGPHLKKAANRDAKRAQLQEAGITADDETITDDMRALLAEED